MRDAVEDLKATKSLNTTLGLVGDHATHSTPEELGGRAVMNLTVSLVVVALLVHESDHVHLIAEEGTRDLAELSTDADNLLTTEQLLCDERSSTAKEVAAEVNDDRLMREHRTQRQQQTNKQK